MKRKQLNWNLYIVAIILFIFAIGYYLYLEVYTKSKEANIIATKSRILELMSKNLEAKVKSIGNNAVEYVKYLTKPGQKNSTSKDFYAMLKDQTDIQYYNENLEYVNSAKPDKYNIAQGDTIKVSPEAKWDFLYFRLVLGEKYKYNEKAIKFRTKYQSLMTDFMQRNIFNDYILIVDSNIVYSTLPGMPSLALIEKGNEKAKGDESGTVKEASPDNMEFTIKSKINHAVIKGVTTYDINISNSQYKLFMCQMQVEKNYLYVCGLVKTELISQSKKGMAPWLVILIFMIVSLTILGLPFIKLKVISQTEQLTSVTLLNAAISLFLGTSFIILFIFFVTNAYWNKSQNETRLKSLADEINVSLNTEIEIASNQLVFYDGINSPKYPSISNILVKDSLKTSNYPGYYPYFDYVFWIGAKGMQEGELTPFSRGDKPTNLSKRDYFNKTDEWVLPHDETRRFRMESIVSLTSGAVKVAISNPSVNYPVIAMTARFYSIIEPIIPVDYKFCIIDKNGLVWFHSDKLRNLQENFITECRNDESLSAAIYANATKMMDLNYYDEPYRIYVKPLSSMPLYLVTMFDKHAEYAYQVQGLMLTLLLFSAFVVFLIMEILVLYALKPLRRKTGWKNMIMDFFSANEDFSKIYVVMSVLFVLVTILYFNLTNPTNSLNPLLFALVIVSYLFPYIKYAMNGFLLKSFERNFFAIINIAILIVINAEASRFLSSNDLDKIMTFQKAIIVLLVVCYIVLQINFTMKYTSCNITFYICFLLGLLLVFSVAPAVKFFEASVNHEIIRGIKHDQLMLARHRELRNSQIRKYYKLMEQDNHVLHSSVEKVYEQRLELGIYSKFVGSTIYIKDKTNWKEIDSDSKKFLENNKIKDKQVGEDIINFFRPIYDNASIETKFLGSDTLLNGRQRWSLLDTLLVYDYSSTTEQDKKTKPDSCRIITNINRRNIFNPQISNKLINKGALFQKFDIIFGLFLMFVLYGIYYIILFGTRKMLGISILEMHTEYNFGNFIRERIASGHSVLVIGSPFINLVKYITEKLNDGFVLSFLDFAKKEVEPERKKSDNENEVLVIENFAFDYYSPTSLANQLEKMNQKIRQKEKIVIIGLNAPYFIKDFWSKRQK